MKNVNISSSLEAKFRQSFLNDHSKFIHASWLLKEDLGKTSVIDGVTYTIVGLWDLSGSRRLILLKGERGGYAFEDSKIVSEGMGFYNMRNQVTGVEHKGWVFDGRKEIPTAVTEAVEEPTKAKDEETSGVWTRLDQEAISDEEDTVDEEDDIDPLVRALQQDLTDEDII